MPPPKRTNGQRFFLTYSQANNIDIDELADFIAATASCWLEIVQEDHELEGIHYHVVVCYDERFQQPLTVWDYDGCHPNFAAIRNATVQLTNYRHYIRKGKRKEEDQHTVKDHKLKACDYIIDPDTRGDVPPYVTSTGRLDWGGIMAAATGEQEFLQLVRTNQPKEWVLRNDAIVKYASTYYKKAREPEKVYPAESWNISPAMDDWCKEVFGEVCFYSGTFTRTSLGLIHSEY